MVTSIGYNLSTRGIPSNINSAQGIDMGYGITQARGIRMRHSISRVQSTCDKSDTCKSNTQAKWDTFGPDTVM